MFDQLRALRIPPSTGCDDRTFLRRAFLDATGTLPTPEEVAAFENDRAPDAYARVYGPTTGDRIRLGGTSSSWRAMCQIVFTS